MSLSSRFCMLFGKEHVIGCMKTVMKNKHVTEKFLEVTFTEPVKKTELAKLGRIKEFDKMRVVLAVKKEDAKDMAVTILKKFPVDDILINAPDVDEVIRKAFAEKKSPN